MRAVKPIPYRADYFGSKLHVEQNEKLEMCGVTLLVEIDTDSLQLLGHLSPSKVTYKYALYLFFSLSNTITVYLVFLLIFSMSLSTAFSSFPVSNIIRNCSLDILTCLILGESYK